MFRLKIGFKIVFTFCFTSFVAASSFAQRESFPKGYFLFPINPGEKNTLAGGLGDLRANHFHAGIDIRTQQREGLEVLAAAEGYVSKIKVQTTGYGNVIFIKHPNGMTTVYGHLQSFAEPMATYFRQKQYDQRTFELEINPAPNQFPVQKGQLIGFSGNTGGSGGPHLHFEIRDSKDNYLNPLFFGFQEVEDEIPPYFQSLALRPMTLTSRLNGEFNRLIAKPVRQKNGTYSLNQTVRAWGTLGVELVAFDAMNGVNFRNGVNCVEIKVDSQEVFAFNMTSFPNWTTRDYNNVIDYATEQRTGVRFLKCYDPDGNKYSNYKTNGYRGKIQIQDTLTHEVQITLFDAFENSSVLVFKLKGEMPAYVPAVAEAPEMPLNPAYIKADVSENILKISAFGLSQAVQSELFVQKSTYKLAPAYVVGAETVYLLNLKEFLPDSVRIGQRVGYFYLKNRVLPDRLETYKGDGYALRFGNQSIFDTLYLAVQKRPNGLQINDASIPLRDAIAVSFEPEKLPEIPEKTHAYRFDGERLRFAGGKWDKNTIHFTTRELGNFSLATDTVPPRIRLVRSDKQRIEAQISDPLSGVASFNAYVNNEWVLMNYDYKRNAIWSEKLVDSTDFAGSLRLEITDRAGNVAVVESEIKEAAPKRVAVVGKKGKKIAKSKIKKSAKRRKK